MAGSSEVSRYYLRFKTISYLCDVEKRPAWRWVPPAGPRIKGCPQIFELLWLNLKAFSESVRVPPRTSLSPSCTDSRLLKSVSAKLRTRAQFHRCDSAC